MASYRFCRSDDIPLLVRAYDVCFRPHFPDAPELTIDDIKRAVREIDFWSSGCMVAREGDEPVAVALATKRATEAGIYRIGTRPDRLRRGHAGHLLTSLSAKLAILGPPRLVAEVPDGPAARGFFESCGYRREAEYSEFVRPASPADGSGTELLVEVTVDDLRSAGALDPGARPIWERAAETIARRAGSLHGLAVVSAERIEAHLLYEDPPEPAERSIVALGCADPAKRALWFGLLLRAVGTVKLRIAGVPKDEIPRELATACGLVERSRTIGYAAQAVS